MPVIYNPPHGLRERGGQQTVGKLLHLLASFALRQFGYHSVNFWSQVILCLKAIMSTTAFALWIIRLWGVFVWSPVRVSSAED